MKLAAFEAKWVEAVLSGFASPSASGLVPQPKEVDWVSAFERIQAACNEKGRVGARAAVWIVALAPLWHHGRWATFAALSPEERTAELSSLLEHRSFLVRELTTFLKMQSAMALLGSASVRARSGFDRRKVRLPLRRAAEEVA